MLPIDMHDLSPFIALILKPGLEKVLPGLWELAKSAKRKPAITASMQASESSDVAVMTLDQAPDVLDRLQRAEDNEGLEYQKILAAAAVSSVKGEFILPALPLAGRIFQGAEFEEPHTPIWELWRRLLARACDKSRVGEAHPAFPGIISQLAVSEVVLLDSYRNSQTPIIHVYRGLNPSMGMDGFQWRLAASNEQLPDRDLAPVYVDHLVQLGLIKEKPLSRPMVVRIPEGDLHIDTRSIVFNLTAFGQLFLKAVIEPDPT